MTRTLVLTVTVVLFGFIGLQSVALTSDQAGGADSVGTLRYGQLVQLSLLPESLGAVYREGLDPQVGFWIYPEEPVVVQVTLSNRSGKSIDVPRQPREWFEAARIQLVEKVSGQKLDANTPQARELSGRLLQRSRYGPASLTADALRLGTGSSETVRLELDRSQRVDVRPGIYALSVSIDRRFVVTESGNPLPPAEKLVGVRAIESRADVMNQAAHMAMWATMAKDFDTARRWVRELLAVHPGSSVGYTHMGNVAEAQGLRKEAIANWEKALQIITDDSDTEARDLGRFGREDGISSLRLKIQRCH